MKNNSKSAGDANETIKWKIILKVREMLAWQSNAKIILKSARDANVTIKQKIILKVREILT